MKLIILFLFSSLIFVPSVFAHCGTCGKGDSKAVAACEKGTDGECAKCEKDEAGKCVECKKHKDGKCAKCAEGKRDCGDKAKSDGNSAPEQQGDQKQKAAPAAKPAKPQGQQTTGAAGQGNKK